MGVHSHHTATRNGRLGMARCLSGSWLAFKAFICADARIRKGKPRVDPGPENVLSFATRVDVEDEGLIRPLFDCVAFCGAREDCGRLATAGPGLFVFRGALNVPTRGDGASAGDSAEVPAGFLVLVS